MSKDSNKNDSKNSDDSKYIDWPHVGAGIFEALGKSEKIFDDAKFLFDNKKYHSSIPFFINSIEESLKAHEFSIKFRKHQTISKDEWNKLLDHKHKLVHIKEFILENLEKMDEKTSEEIKKETGNEDVNVNLEQMKKLMKTQMNIASHLQSLKEKCMYTDWDEKNGEWDNFDKMDESKQEDLAFYLMKKAEEELTQLHFGLEFAVNTLRKEGTKLKNLPFPKYNEFRNIKDYESRKLIKQLDRGELQKFARGERIMEKFVATKTFQEVFQQVPFDMLKKVVNLSQKHSPENWYPHPIIRALFLALSALHQKEEEGKNYAGFSGNAEETYEGNPTMTTTAIVSKKGGNISLEKIIIITDKADEYDFSDKIIEKILETELVIERFPGKDIPIEAAHEAFSKIGIKLRKLKDDEIELAIDYAKKVIDKVQGVQKDLIPKVKNTTKENWENANPMIRSLIATTYLSTLKPEKNTLILSSYSDPIRKFKIRDSIYQFLKNNFFINNF